MLGFVISYKQPGSLSNLFYAKTKHSFSTSFRSKPTINVYLWFFHFFFLFWANVINGRQGRSFQTEEKYVRYFFIFALFSFLHHLHCTETTDILSPISGPLPYPPAIGITTIWKLCPHTSGFPTSTTTVLLATCHCLQDLWLQCWEIFFEVVEAFWSHNSCNEKNK